jgi:PadR family transcriptional regulator, regulatory protein PadR
MDPRYSIGMPNREQTRAEVLQGTLDLMVLQTLNALGPLHGYAIAARLEQVSGGALQLNMGTLYPALMRLEQRGLLRGNWGTTDSNRNARFYGLTAAGRRALAKERQAWDRMAAIMHALLRGEA